MSKETMVATLTEAAEELIALANAVQDGLMTRVRDGMEGHPRSPSLDAGQSTNRPPEDLPDELRGRSNHSDPTGSAAVQVVLRGDRARDDALALAKIAKLARKAARDGMLIASRYNPRPANVTEQTGEGADDGCRSCERVKGHGGKPFYSKAVRTTTLASGAKVDLCNFCYETPRDGARWSGMMPPVEVVKSYRDIGRAPRKSA